MPETATLTDLASRRSPWRSVALGLLICLLAGIVPSTSAQAPGRRAAADAGDNVRVTLRVGRLVDGRSMTVNTYELLVTVDSEPTEFLAGRRIPLVRQEQRVDDEVVVTDYDYQSVGFSAQIWVESVTGSRLRLRGSIEDSTIVSSGPTPTIETHQLRIDTVVADGATQELMRIDAPGGTKGFVEATVATVDP